MAFGVAWRRVARRSSRRVVVVSVERRLWRSSWRGVGFTWRLAWRQLAGGITVASSSAGGWSGVVAVGVGRVAWRQVVAWRGVASGVAVALVASLVAVGRCIGGR
ncbi:hypothetical protein ACXZ9C_11860 [Streptococcus agalactiae]